MANTPQPGTRERIVRAAALSMQRQAYEGTGIKQVAQEARATLGPVCHLFPGGNKALEVAAVQHADQEFADLLSAPLPGDAGPAKAIAGCARRLPAICAHPSGRLTDQRDRAGNHWASP
ncbi:TetR/AcrR family transcriptional regulator [Streptomyces sp. NPDC058052]|uniref:TetR/AcrR family transcriptional regulator n=1 Tax=Streptomyces sp. NPDC058052 TaxID=3346316 RepID=UPI0036EC84F2